jgi:hypothetical protein
MAELVSCQTYTVECPLCGRTKVQNTFCKEVAQAVGTFSYNMDSRELSTH